METVTQTIQLQWSPLADYRALQWTVNVTNLQKSNLVSWQFCSSPQQSNICRETLKRLCFCTVCLAVSHKHGLQGFKVCVCVCLRAWLCVYTIQVAQLWLILTENTKSPSSPRAMPVTKHCCVYGEHTERSPCTLAGTKVRSHCSVQTAGRETGATRSMPGKRFRKAFADLSLPSKNRLATWSRISCWIKDAEVTSIFAHVCHSWSGLTWGRDGRLRPRVLQLRTWAPDRRSTVWLEMTHSVWHWVILESNLPVWVSWQFQKWDGSCGEQRHPNYASRKHINEHKYTVTTQRGDSDTHKNGDFPFHFPCTSLEVSRVDVQSHCAQQNKRPEKGLPSQSLQLHLHFGSESFHYKLKQFFSIKLNSFGALQYSYISIALFCFFFRRMTTGRFN